MRLIYNPNDGGWYWERRDWKRLQRQPYSPHSPRRPWPARTGDETVPTQR
jgi:hypothetical protein